MTILVAARPLGALLVGGCLWQAGRVLTRPLRERPVELKGWQDVLARLESEIGWDGRALLVALTRAQTQAPAGVARCLARFCAHAEDPISTAELWSEALHGEGFLSAEDRAVLAALGPVLGRYSREEQRRHLGELRERLRRQEMQAEAAARREGRALATVLALAGAALAVLMV
jgi:stage III sporulation protein AB